MVMHVMGRPKAGNRKLCAMNRRGSLSYLGFGVLANAVYLCVDYERVACTVLGDGVVAVLGQPCVPAV